MTQGCYHAYTKKINISDQSKTVGMYYRILKPDQHIPIQSEASQVEGIVVQVHVCVCVRYFSNPTMQGNALYINNVKVHWQG